MHLLPENLCMLCQEGQGRAGVSQIISSQVCYPLFASLELVLWTCGGALESGCVRTHVGCHCLPKLQKSYLANLAEASGIDAKLRGNAVSAARVPSSLSSRGVLLLSRKTRTVISGSKWQTIWHKGEWFGGIQVDMLPVLDFSDAWTSMRRLVSTAWSIDELRMWGQLQAGESFANFVMNGGSFIIFEFELFRFLGVRAEHKCQCLFLCPLETYSNGQWDATNELAVLRNRESKAQFFAFLLLIIADLVAGMLIRANWQQTD